MNRVLAIILSGVSFIGAYSSYLYLPHSTPYNIPTLGVTLVTALVATGLAGIIYAVLPLDGSYPFACFWYYAENPIEEFTTPWAAVFIGAIMVVVMLVITWVIVVQMQNTIKPFDGCQNPSNLTQACVFLNKIVRNGAT